MKPIRTNPNPTHCHAHGKTNGRGLKSVTTFSLGQENVRCGTHIACYVIHRFFSFRFLENISESQMRHRFRVPTGFSFRVPASSDRLLIAQFLQLIVTVEWWPTTWNTDNNYPHINIEYGTTRGKGQVKRLWSHHTRTQKSKIR